MKGKIWGGMIALLFFISCNDTDIPNVNGMWQLKTIEDENHVISPIDTIFYSFQRQAIFSYTILHEKENVAATAEILFGYVNFPSDKKMLIQLDKRYHVLQSKTFWNDSVVTYDILQLSAKKMVLSEDNKIYSFVKY